VQVVLAFPLLWHKAKSFDSGELDAALAGNVEAFKPRARVARQAARKAAARKKAGKS
jgi:hypothetical protein